eukprot:139335-Prorocentrum_minimum.AAC.1
MLSPSVGSERRPWVRVSFTIVRTLDASACAPRQPSDQKPTRAAHGHPGLFGEDSAYPRQLSPLLGWRLGCWGVSWAFWGVECILAVFGTGGPVTRSDIVTFVRRRRDIRRLDAPLVEGVDPPDEALHGDAVLVHGQQLPRGVRVQAGEQNAQRGPVAGERLVGNQVVGDALRPQLNRVLARRERVRL